MTLRGFRRWLEVLRVEKRSFSFPDAIRELLGSAPLPSAGVRLARYRACSRCLLFDRVRRRCRPFDGSELGCGCSMPLAVLSGHPCWAWETTGPEEQAKFERVGWPMPLVYPLAPPVSYPRLTRLGVLLRVWFGVKSCRKRN